MLTQWAIVVALALLGVWLIIKYVERSNMDIPPSAEKIVPDGKGWNGRDIQEGEPGF